MTSRAEILLQKNPDGVQAIASLTKLMSAMVVLDGAQAMEETLTIDGADVDRLKHSGSHIPVGASLEREEMLRLALMSSENRAASALSRAFPGGQPAFIQTMNNKARALHMASTHFDDPTGLSPDNLSTARDVVKMAAAASHYPVIGSFTRSRVRKKPSVAERGSITTPTGRPAVGLGRSARENRLHARGRTMHRGRRQHARWPVDHRAARRALITGTLHRPRHDSPLA